MKSHVALILKKDDKVLFVQRSLKKKTLPGKWAFVSGTVEEKESVFATAHREAQEELGIGITNLVSLAELELPEFNSKLHFILCNSDSEPIIKAEDEIEKMEWMTFTEFFNKFTDEEIGHGLIWLRKNKEILKIA